MSERDNCQRFIFDQTAVRGEIAHLDASYHKIMTQHDYPPIIRELLGETLVSAVLLAETIKFEGQLTLQLQSDGPVMLLVAKCNSEGEIRGLAQWQEDAILTDTAGALGDGRLVVTIEYAKRVEPHQSIIALQGNTIAGALEDYFERSEQIPTKIFTASNQDTVAGVLLQALPCQGEEADRTASLWQDADALLQTLTSDELLTLDNQTVLHRLFHEYDVRIFDPKPIAFYCPCSIERMQRAIVTLGEKEALEELKHNRELAVTCEYCNQSYGFNRAEVEALFRRH